MPRIFISYRRDDSSGHAGRLYDDLTDHFDRERVFMDVDAIAPGADFVEVIEEAVGRTDVMLVLIGRRWLTAADNRRRRRLNNPADFVRLEIETAFRHGKRVIPVLVGNAEMPAAEDLPESLAALARRHAMEIRDARWRDDVASLVRALEQIPDGGATAPTNQADSGARPAERATQPASPPAPIADLDQERRQRTAAAAGAQELDQQATQTAAQTGVGPRSGPAPGPGDQREPRRRRVPPAALLGIPILVGVLFVGWLLSRPPPPPASPTPAPAKPTAAAGTAASPAASPGGAVPVPSPTSTVPPSPPAVKPTEAAKPAAQPQSPSAAPSGAGLSGTIKIVSSLPRTGLAKGQTDSIVNAFRMALEEASNRVGGATIVYEDLDDATPARGAWDAGKEAENANRAVNDPDVMVYLGTFNSGAAKVAIPILNRANLVMISPANTYPGLTKKVAGVEPTEPDVYYPSGVRNYARVVPSDDLQGAAAANWTRALGATKVYVLSDGELYGHGIAAVFAETARKIGLQLLGGPEVVDPKGSDYGALAAKIRTANPDLVFFGGITQNNAGKLFKDLRAALGPGIKLMGPDGIFEQAFLDEAGEAAEGAYITFGGPSPSRQTPRSAEWRQTYRRKYNAEPEAYAAYGYEAMKVALDAIQRAGRKDRSAIREAVFNTWNYNGIFGTWSFDRNGDTSLTQMSGRQVKGGKFDEANSAIIESP